MKYPLKRKPFPSLRLSEIDAEEIQETANVCVARTLSEYEHFLIDKKKVKDDKKVKLLKRHQNLAVYQDRTAKVALQVVPTVRPSTFTDAGVGMKQQRLLCVGTIDGDLDNLMYGVVNATTESMMIKSSYIHDNVVDCSVLSTIISPSVEDPMRSLVVKWSVNASPLVVRPVVRARDFTYMEATGFTEDSNGERVGYHIIHPVDSASFRELKEHKLVRGILSLYHIYRQKEHNVVEVFMRGFCDPMGTMHPAAAAFACADASIAIRKTLWCSAMKKLTWLLQNNDVLAYRGDPHWCAVCRKALTGSFRTPRCCCICSGRLCWQCRTPQQLSFLTPGTRKVVKKTLSFCTKCVHVAVAANGRSIAEHELISDHRFEEFEVVLSITSSTTSTTSFL